MNSKKRISLLAVLVCVFALVLSLGLFSACGNESANSDNEPAANAQWYYGTTAPAENLAKAGDHYLDTVALKAYVLSENGQWEPTTLYSGTDAPVDENGEVGDLYLNTASGELYQKGETWTVVLTVKGQNGRDGVIWFSGKGEPDKLPEGTLKDVRKGDFYLDTEKFDVWQYAEKEDGTVGWNELGTIMGKEGATGSQGSQGATGQQGPKGDEGKQGPDGKSAYDLYVEQFKADESNAGQEPLGLDAWLASLKGDKGDKGTDSVHFFNGEGKPEGNDAVQGAVEGDLYVGKFYGLDGSDAGSVLYRLIDGKWVPIMESLTKGQVDLDSLEKIIEFRELVAAGNTFKGVEVHLKSDIDFNDVSGASYGRRAAARAVAWEPIGTSDHPFEGTFDGENHTIRNFSVTTSDTKKPAGFFGNVSGAIIRDLHFENATVTATGTGVVAAVVVGEAKGDVTMNNVTVSGGKVEAQESAKVGGLVGSATEGNVTAKDVEVTVPELDGGEDGKQAFVGDGDITMEGDYATGKEVGTGFVQKTEYSATGEVTSTSYEVLNKAGLTAFAKSVNGTDGEAKNYYGETITLADDIDLAGENWTPIGNASKYEFRGSFDGQGHTIFNLKIAEATTCCGLFGRVGINSTDATNKIKSVIENLTIENVDISVATEGVGAFVGQAYGTDLKNLTLKGNVNITSEGKTGVGGIVGKYWMLYNTNYTVKESVVENITVDAKGTISAKGICGAVLGGVTRTASTVSTLNFIVSNIVVKDVTLKGVYEVGGVIGGVMSSSGLQNSVLTVDGVTMTDVKIIASTDRDGYKTYYGAIMGADRYGDKQTVTIKNLSGTFSVESGSTKYPAEPLHKGVIGEMIEGLEPTIENNTLEITWNGEPLVAE